MSALDKAREVWSRSARIRKWGGYLLASVVVLKALGFGWLMALLPVAVGALWLGGTAALLWFHEQGE